MLGSKLTDVVVETDQRTAELCPGCQYPAPNTLTARKLTLVTLHNDPYP